MCSDSKPDGWREQIATSASFLLRHSSKHDNSTRNRSERCDKKERFEEEN